MPNTQPPVVPNSQDLLAEIFGSSSSTSTPSAPPKASVNDILGLFDSPTPSNKSPAQTLASVSSPTPTPTPSLTPAQSMSPQPVANAAPRLQSYTAYEKNELRITLTPQVSAQRAGTVNILARFQVTGSNTATSINFQAAVPKVPLRFVF